MADEAVSVALDVWHAACHAEKTQLEAMVAVVAAVRGALADEIRGKIVEWEPHCSDPYIRGMRAALLYVTGDAHLPLFAADREAQL